MTELRHGYTTYDSIYEAGDYAVGGDNKVGFDVWHLPTGLRVPAGLPGRPMFAGAGFSEPRNWRQQFWFSKRTDAKKYMLALAAWDGIGELTGRDAAEALVRWLENQ